MVFGDYFFGLVAIIKRIIPETVSECSQESNKILKPLKYPRIPPFPHDHEDNFLHFITGTRNWLLQTTSKDFSFLRLVSGRGYQYGCNNQKNSSQNSPKSDCKNQIRSWNRLNILESHHFITSTEIISSIYHAHAELIIAEYERGFFIFEVGFVKRISLWLQ